MRAASKISLSDQSLAIARTLRLTIDIVERSQIYLPHLTLCESTDSDGECASSLGWVGTWCRFTDHASVARETSARISAWSPGAIIEAYKAGIPGNGKPFPEPPRWRRSIGRRRRTPSRPGDPTVPGTLDDVDFMVKDSDLFLLM